MTFIIFILITALLMEGIGSFISVVGLSALFASDPVILTMAVILDVAKIASVSFLYQYWGEINRAMKSYMLSAVLILMLITSAGAFGYLSGALQKAIQPNREVMLRVDTLKKEAATLEQEQTKLTERREKISKQIAELPANYSRSRTQLINSFKPETNLIDVRASQLTKRLDQIRTELPKIEAENIEKEVHIGPISYVAKILDISMEDASKWVILTIVLVFDPLAIMLVIAANFLIARRQSTPTEKFYAKMETPIRKVGVEPSQPWPRTAIVDREHVEPPAPWPHPSTKAELRPAPIPEVESEVLLPGVQEPVIAEEIVPTEVALETTYSGGAQAPLIDEDSSIMKHVNVNLKSALIREGVVTPSRKRAFYE